MVHYHLLGAEFGPVIFERLYGLLTEAQLDERKGDRFTPREVIAHLADWEPIFRQRIQAALDEDGRAVEGIDEGELAIRNNYAQANVADTLARFAKERAATVAMIRALDPALLDRAYNHSERGRVTIRETGNVLSAHDTYHVEQITEYLANKVVGTW
ncbi:MAG: DinB family protein [Chthonomonas sp.]|nr:DinB family protein [Chthonomonas sp.]